MALFDVQPDPSATAAPVGVRAREIPSLPDAVRSVMAVVPDGEDRVKVFVLASSTADQLVLSEIQRLRRAGFAVQVSPCSADDLHDAIESARKAQDGTRSEADPRIIGMARALFAEAALLRASDIHIRVSTHTVIYLRVNGNFQLLREISRDEGRQFLRSLYQGQAGSTGVSYQELEFQDGQVTDRSVLPDGIAALRVQRGPMLGGEFMVLRLLSAPMRNKGERRRAVNGSSVGSVGMARFTDFGYVRDQAAALVAVARQPFGLTIFSGPTGSAKSTALKTALEYQHDIYPHKTVYTIEDPSEYPIDGAVQLSLAGASSDEARKTMFQKALRVAMRSDPDILMVGEIRDNVTASLAFDAVLTGHQMWSTVHAQDVFLVVTRLIRLGLDPREFVNPAILRLMVGQRLIPTLCSHCALPFDRFVRYMDPDLVAIIQEWDVPTTRLRMAHPQGCPACHKTGISGRAVVAEVVTMTPDLAARLREDVAAAADYWRKTEGNLSFADHALLHLFAGRCDPAHLLANTGDLPKTLSATLRQFLVMQQQSAA